MFSVLMFANRGKAVNREQYWKPIIHDGELAGWSLFESGGWLFGFRWVKYVWVDK